MIWAIFILLATSFGLLVWALEEIIAHKELNQANARLDAAINARYSEPRMTAEEIAAMHATRWDGD